MNHHIGAGIFNWTTFLFLFHCDRCKSSDEPKHQEQSRPTICHTGAKSLGLKPHPKETIIQITKWAKTSGTATPTDCRTGAKSLGLKSHDKEAIIIQLTIFYLEWLSFHFFHCDRCKSFRWTQTSGTVKTYRLPYGHQESRFKVPSEGDNYRINVGNLPWMTFLSFIHCDRCKSSDEPKHQEQPRPTDSYTSWTLLFRFQRFFITSGCKNCPE